ncbi:hypothetical protein B0H14DRAFT_2584415 [Mycena olivaceomarginata]|nr:hypothetical protein B0H14DRAFT_2584415 [Mycena olivaceomarginata]
MAGERFEEYTGSDGHLGYFGVKPCCARRDSKASLVAIDHILSRGLGDLPAGFAITTDGDLVRFGSAEDLELDVVAGDLPLSLRRPKRATTRYGGDNAYFRAPKEALEHGERGKKLIFSLLAEAKRSSVQALQYSSHGVASFGMVASPDFG